METPKWWDYLRRSNVTPKEVINLPPVSSYDQAICACLFYCVVIWEKTYCTSCVLFACCSIRMRSAHAWNVNEVVSVIDSMCWHFSPMFSCIYMSINTQIVLCVFDCYILFIYSYYTQQVIIYICDISS